MITSKTPLRISFCGGGTDLKSYYEDDWGAVVSTTIDKYNYLIVNKRFDGDIRLSYSRTEIVDSVDKVEHPLLREAMRKTGADRAIEIMGSADIPSRGSGLGSSSCYLVGLLNALYVFKDNGSSVSAERLAKDACDIEINILGEPIGRQDQYACAYGGLNFIRFNMDEGVEVKPIKCSAGTRKALDENLLLFFTGITRNASSILAEQNGKTKSKKESLVKMKDLALRTRDALESDSLEEFGKLLHENWLLKKGLASKISNSVIDSYYEKALKAGALGGKISGAGGGGFMLIYAEREKQNAVRKALSELREMRFSFEPEGSKIIYNEK